MNYWEKMYITFFLITVSSIRRELPQSRGIIKYWILSFKGFKTLSPVHTLLLHVFWSPLKKIRNHFYHCVKRLEMHESSWIFHWRFYGFFPKFSLKIFFCFTRWRWGGHRQLARSSKPPDEPGNFLQLRFMVQYDYGQSG